MSDNIVKLYKIFKLLSMVLIHKNFLFTVDGSFKSLSIEFSLRPSNYATMVVRQITKQDTSSHTQASLCKMSNNKRGATEEEENTRKKIRLDVSTED